MVYPATQTRSVPIELEPVAVDHHGAHRVERVLERQQIPDGFEGSADLLEVEPGATEDRQQQDDRVGTGQCGDAEQGAERHSQADVEDRHEKQHDHEEERIAGVLGAEERSAGEDHEALDDRYGEVGHRVAPDEVARPERGGQQP